MNFHPNTSKEHFLKLLGSKGVQIPNKNNIHLYKTEDPAYVYPDDIPMFFDARKKWSSCRTIGAVRDQGNCKSCWVCRNIFDMCRELDNHLKLIIYLGDGHKLGFC